MATDRTLSGGTNEHTQSQGRLVGGRYRLRSPVGRGGMGMVWHAHDVVLGRDVAVKELLLPYGLDQAGTESAHRRVLREARSAARLAHPGIVTVHDVVEEDGRPWIVMELVRAWSLEQAVRQSGPLPVTQAAEIGLRVLDALRHAHAAGVLHRDVKPGNVLLTADRVVLTDFGIAAVEGDVTVTQTGLLMGSPAYIPPERLSGQPVTAAADLWSFGATLYAAVEGRPPYEGGDAVAVLGAVLTQDPVSPLRAGALRPVIDGLLRKDPVERMTSEQVAAALEQVLLTHGTAARNALPTSGNSTPIQLLPPLDPPSGPLPTRVVETPSGPVRVPYDPAGPTRRQDPPTGLPGDRARPDHVPAPREFSAPPEERPQPILPLTAGVGGDSGSWPQASPGVPARADGGARRSRSRRRGEPRTARIRPALLATGAAGLGAAVLTAVLVTSGGEPAPQRSAGPTAEAPREEQEPPALAALPKGFREEHTAKGFTAALPTSWKAGSAEGETVFTGPRDSGSTITVRRVPAERDGGLAKLTAMEAEGGMDAYIQVRLEKTSFRDWRAADWEYTWSTANGVPMRTLARHVTLDDTRAFLIVCTMPELGWDDQAKTRKVFLDAFAPAD